MGIKILKKKKGVSPVVATVLLVVMVIVIGLIIFLWFRSFTQEAVTKFGGRNIALVCDDVQLLGSYSGNTLTVSNIGNVPVYSVKLKVSKGRSYQTDNIEDISDNWPALTGLKQGAVFSDSSIDLDDATNVLMIPVLVGMSSEGEKTHVCEDRNGQEIVI
ncbi:MAG: hypothetical protein KJ905_03775 [Nanoarchaeota archaeon]|nr:hypothetical protein [Nanoarchaeota archaeon]MBU1501860.1 hypothetical protein [Nanoarchaeota archaeon]MBU2458854.1 hypothetical protein [Nanoarchaeota archaeon]